MQRDEARRLMRIGREARLQGLPPPTNEPPWIGAGLLMLDKLRDPTRGHGAGEAAAIALDLLEATMARRTSREPVECARGCNFCCSSVVSVTAPEAFRLARWLQQNSAGRSADQKPEALVARALERRGFSLAELQQRKPGCLLLVDGACSVYTARPGNCRRLLSASKAACQADFEGRPTAIPVNQEAMQKGTHLRALLLAAVASAGLPTTAYELSQALSVALGRPDAEARWLAGEDVFAGLALQQEAGTLQAAIDHWQRLIRRVM